MRICRATLHRRGQGGLFFIDSIYVEAETNHEHHSIQTATMKRQACGILRLPNRQHANTVLQGVNKQNQPDEKSTATMLHGEPDAHVPATKRSKPDQTHLSALIHLGISRSMNPLAQKQRAAVGGQLEIFGTVYMSEYEIIYMPVRRGRSITVA